jgi:hypothetical protein
MAFVAKIMRIAGLSTLLGGIAATGARSARAQPQQPPATATQIFNAALVLMQQGDWAGACPKFQASMDLNPSAGAQINIAQCHDHEGKLALAYQDYEAARNLNEIDADAARKKRRVALIDAGLVTLEPQVAKLRIAISHPPEGLRLTRSGEELPPGSLDHALVVDPGTYDIVAEAPGYRSDHRAVTLAMGTTVDVELTLPLEPLPAPAPAPVVVPAGGLPVVAAPPRPNPPPSDESAAGPPADGKTQRLAGIIVGSVGLASLVTAGGFAILTVSKASESSPYCQSNDVCQQHGLDLRDDARRAQTAGFVLLGVGAAAVTVGVVLFAKAPSSPTGPIAQIRTTLGPGGISFRGSF